jgi:hypothetical protein
MENLGVYIRATKDEINTLIDIINKSYEIILYEIIEVKKDTFSHEYWGLTTVSRKVYKGETLLYIIFKDENKKNRLSRNLQEQSKIKFDFFFRDTLNI